MSKKYHSIETLCSDIENRGFEYEKIKPYVRYDSEGIGEKVVGILIFSGYVVGMVVWNLFNGLWEIHSNY